MSNKQARMGGKGSLQARLSTQMPQASMPLWAYLSEVFVAIVLVERIQRGS